jgi:hypothetical protein
MIASLSFTSLRAAPVASLLSLALLLRFARK